MKCYLPGVPRITYIGWPFQIIQTADIVTLNYEWSHKKRQIPVTKVAAAAVAGGRQQLERASSRGRWDGDTLVVETSNLNGLTWFDQMGGNFLSSEARLRSPSAITYVDANTLHYQETITDPKVFTRPWTIAQAMQRSAAKDVGILDYECTAMLDELGIHHTWPREFEPPEF